MERYDKIEPIGSGTFGQAWLVESVISQRRYALKELGVTAMSEQDRHLALNEAKILSKLKHKNIVRYKEAFVAQGKLCIVMEFAENGDLYTRIRERNGVYFLETQVLEWFTQLCLALKYLHGQNILHRDLKTQNIFLSKDDVIKLGDFGIARMLNGTLDHAQTTVGTPYYLSPEICQRKPYNHKSDMWSLGCVLYEMATLKHAFNANHFSALVIKILQEQYPPVPGCYGPLVEDLVSVLLQKNPDDRPSAKQLLYVPAMQPYVKSFLISERDRTESVASDIADFSSTSRHECCQMSGVEREENIKNTSRMVAPVAEKSILSKEDGQSVAKDIHPRQRRTLLDNATKSLANLPAFYNKPTVRENSYRNAREMQGHVQAYNNTSKDRENLTTSRSIPQKGDEEAGRSFQHEDTLKARENCPLSLENIHKARENLNARRSSGTKKQSLIALANAQQRRYSEQISTCSGSEARIHKSRIHSQRCREFVDTEDDVFAKNQVTAIPVRAAKNRNVGINTQAIVKHVSSSCRSNVTSNPEQKRRKPEFTVSQPKRSEDVHKSKRHHSAVADRSVHSVEQRHQRCLNLLDSNVQDKENVTQERLLSAHVQVRRPISSGVLKEIQATNVKQQMVKPSPEGIVDGAEDRKRTYTVSHERRLSEFEIPEVVGKEHAGSDKKGSETFQDVNLCAVQRGKPSLAYQNTNYENPLCHQFISKGHEYENLFQVNLKNANLGATSESIAQCQTPSCKFMFCGKTLQHDNVTDHDSVYSHMEALRMHLEEELGTKLLTAVYRYITNVPLEERERVEQTVMCMLGEEYMTYLPVLLQLVACEALFFH